jgi:hypothetical protein
MSEPLTPGMVRRLGLGVRLEKMVQDVQQSQHMLPVAPDLGLPNIVDNHVSNSFASVVLRQEVLSERRRCYFGKVFMFSNGKHFLIGQAAESDAIFQRNHVRARPR